LNEYFQKEWKFMSIDKSLRKRGSLVRARNVLKRDERIEKLKELERWTEEHGPFNLPKTRVARVVAKKSAPKKAEEAADGKTPAATGAAATPAAAAKPAAKPAAKGGKK
jgi:small basic protein (TIGR04137 family)